MSCSICETKAGTDRNEILQLYTAGNAAEWRYYINVKRLHKARLYDDAAPDLT